MRRELAIGAVAALVTVSAGCGLDHTNEQRLHVLQHDPVLQCPVGGMTPWHVLDNAGTTHGVGFGGTSPTEVSRIFRLMGAAKQVAADLYACAVRSGWSVRPSPGSPMFNFTASKTFEHKWTALLETFVGDHVFEGQPAVEITITTEPV